MLVDRVLLSGKVIRIVAERSKDEDVARNEILVYNNGEHYQYKYMTNPEVVRKLTDRVTDENISPAELKELAKDDTRTALLDEAKRMTADNLRAMKDEIEAERAEADAQALDPTEKTALDGLVGDLNQLIASQPAPPPVEVSDIFVEKPADQRTMADTIKNFIKSTGIIGSLAKAYISFQRTWGSLFGGVDEGKVKHVENIYGKFFGGRETATWYNEYFKSKGYTIQMVEGFGDGPAFAELKIQHQRLIREKAKEMDPSFDNPSTPAEQKEVALSAAAAAITWESVLADKAEKYVKDFPSSAGEPVVTTLTGIVRSQKPKSAPTVI